MQSPFPDLQLFITGPIYVRPEVRQAGLWPEFGHRDAENRKRFEPIIKNLKTVAGAPDDYEVIIFNGSGTTAMEASIRSLVADGEKVLNVSVGAFGDLYHKLAVVNNKDAVQLKFDPGECIDPARLQVALDKEKPAVVTLTHNETSTGVTNDIQEACRIIKAAGALPLVDGISIFGGAPSHIQETGCGMYITSTQKSLGLPAGFGIAFVSPEAVSRAEKVTNRGFISDILSQLPRAKKFQTLTTPNCTLANQMYMQMDYIVNQEGVQNRFARHVQMRDRVHEFIAGLQGYEFFAPEGYRSPTVTCVRVPEELTPAGLKEIKETLREKGYLFDPGYGKLNDALAQAGKRAVFRIGHLGDMNMDMLNKYLQTLKDMLKA
ncbi:aminotransferase class V-fold PLP-dependent enzyme [Desulfonatronospira sp.]|uniref:pyridoxal-phosphate-dependent aminotransferase family protein n=1 Tax=Desulfonatronospira sp. TaxID=1962951 RepID=UPI0025B9EA98|nr:aminotransferase class V-fold PLP-dependent enzyme [Desulfonatronospira sp.]